MTRKISSLILITAAILLFYFFGEAAVEIIARTRAPSEPQFSISGAIGVVIGATTVGLFLLHLVIRMITRLLFPHLEINDPFGEDTLSESEPDLLPSHKVIESHLNSLDEYWRGEGEKLNRQSPRSRRIRARSRPHPVTV